MLSVAEAVAEVLAEVKPRPAEEVPLQLGAGRVLAEGVRSAFPLPPFDNSQMDGFAVRSADLAGATGTAPVTLRVTGTVAAGARTVPAVEVGCAVRIMTGAPLPPGADAVVKVEDTEPAGGCVGVRVVPSLGEFVRPAGEDVAAGELVLEPGRRLRAADIGLLAAMGRPVARVATRPRVAVLATGDELVPLGGTLGPGQIHNSNAYALSAAAAEVGAEPVLLGICGDDRDELRDAFRAAADFDVVLSTGGVSVGDFDYVKQIMEEVGLKRRFWQVAQRPGKPITFAARDGRLFFGLPGNPVSSLLCFTLYVAPALRRALGLRAIFPAAAKVTMGEGVRTARDLTEFVRCTLEREGAALVARPTGSQSSGVLRSMSLADCLAISPPGSGELRAGERATALLVAPDAPLAESLALP